MAEFQFDYTEINQGFAIVEAETLEEAQTLATEAYYEGSVVWHAVDVSVEESAE